MSVGAAKRPQGPPEAAEPSASARPIPWLVEVWRSQLGKKYAMAITGLLLFGFVFAHMVGNLKAFTGAESLNHYGEFLRDVLAPIAPRGWVLWGLRFGLIAAFAIHILATYQLTRINRRARAGGYRGGYDYTTADYASRTMRWGGVIVLLFTIYHLMDQTWGNAHPDYIRGDVYHNVVTSFSQWPITAVYVVGNVVLGVHLYHGLWSMFQSLGWNNPKFNHWRRAFALSFAVVVTVGFIAVPLAVLAGVIR